MPDNSGFIDLRIGHGAQGVGDDSVWPSFTDIMMVIVMIFMMALVVIMVRNFELSRELLSSTTAREATLLANRDLVEKLMSLESSLVDTTGQRDELRTNLESEIERLETLQSEQALLKTDLDVLTTKRETLELVNSDLEQQKIAAQLEIENLTEREMQARDEIEKLTESEKQKLAEIESLTQREQVALSEIEDLSEREKAALGEIASLTRSEKVARDEIVRLQQVEGSLKNSVTDLENQIGDLENKLSSLEFESRERIASLGEDNRNLGEQIDAVSAQLAALELLSTGQIDQIAALTAEKQTLSEKIDVVSGQLSQFEQSLQQALVDNVALTGNIEELESENRFAGQNLEAASGELGQLSTLITQKEAEIARRQAEVQALEEQASDSLQNYQSLQDEYESLDAKYRKLVRPARSPVGKVVVDVLVEKTDAGMQYKMREPGQATPVFVDKQTLEQKLQALKDKHGANLYTKIIIPADSKLLHDEAWEFTQEIQGKYDYYYQTLPPETE